MCFCTVDDVWGVIDSYLQTDFPDIRNRTMVKSREGTCRVIPREGDLVRLYIQLPSIQSHDTEERIDRKKIDLEMLMESARKIFAPYKLHWPSVQWWAVYITGQRYASNFADENDRIFIAGDACHTHSPKAGQGMNAAMNDTHNLAWKLALVIKGFAHPAILKTYEFERRNYAKQLIEHDHEFANLVSSKTAQNAEETAVAYEELRGAYDRFSGFFSGIAIQYEPSLITVQSLENQALAEAIVIGKSFRSQIVVRHVDAHPFHLGDHMPTDLRFRVLIFAGDCCVSSQLKRIEEASAALEALAKRYTPSSGAYDDLIDFITVSSNPHAAYEKESLPLFLCQNKWKIFCDEVAIDGVCNMFCSFFLLSRVMVPKSENKFRFEI
jgi:phenol 2-monooxygenase